MKPTPPSPRRTISWPAGCLTILSCFSIERTSESGRPWNSFACLISTTPEYYAPAAGLHKDHVEAAEVPALFFGARSAPLLATAAAEMTVRAPARSRSAGYDGA